jgi:hypothetical protein
MSGVSRKRRSHEAYYEDKNLWKRVRSFKSERNLTWADLGEMLSCSSRIVQAWVLHQRRIPQTLAERFILLEQTAADEKRIVVDAPSFMLKICAKKSCSNEFLMTSSARKYCDEHLSYVPKRGSTPNGKHHSRKS